MGWQQTESLFGNQCLGNLTREPDDLWSQRAMGKYKQLINSIYDQSLTKAYPIAYSVIPTDIWDNWVEEFIKNSRSQEPRVWLMPKLFMQYVQQEGLANQIGRPYIDDLLLFEWVEIELFTQEDIAIPQVVTEVDWIQDVVTFNPHHLIISLSYPVHKSTEHDQLMDQGQYTWAVYRDPNTFAVQYVQLGLFDKYCIEYMQKDKLSLGTAILAVMTDLNLSDSDLPAIQARTIEVFDQFISSGFILGKTI